MSPRRFSGWEPTEVHEHYGLDGELTGSTVITREPEWDDLTRDAAEALTLFEDESCHSCGNDLNVSLEPGHSWDVDEKMVCHACAAMAVVQRDDSMAHENDKVAAGHFQYSDGRVYTVKPLNGDD